MNDTEADVLAARQGRIGRLTLNRPSVLNALDLPMVERLTEVLSAWRDDPAVHAVVIQGAGRAFCAGGDIRAVRAAVLCGGHADVERFFAREYALTRLIAEYPKPYVALVHGACMGGGIGVSVHGSARVVTASAMFAMPETAIALFPDVGATYLLPRLRGALGMWMALTGARLNGADALYAGLATHMVEPARMATLADELAEDGPAVLGSLGAPVPSPLADLRPTIDRCFGSDSVLAIVRTLEAERTEWATETLRELRRLSPSSIMWTFAIVREGARRTLPQCLAAELALTRAVTRHPDFAEGVRAMIVDKDRSPSWRPASIEEVDPADTAAVFSR